MIKVKDKKNDLVRCSFCYKASNVVKKMIAGPTRKINICSECIDLCNEVLSDGIKLPNIVIDKEALRFSFSDKSGVNLFWINLFRPLSQQNFQDEILQYLFKAYNECVKND